MKGKFEYSKKEGLPNGANEMETVLKAFFEARMAPFFQPGGPVKPYKPKSQVDYKHRKAAYSDSLGAYNEFKNSVYNDYNEFITTDPASKNSIASFYQNWDTAEDYFKFISDNPSNRGGRDGYDDWDHPIWSNVWNYKLSKKPVQEILPHEPLPGKMPMRSMVNRPSGKPIPPDTSEKYNPKPLRTSPRGQTVLQYNPETGKHEMIERRVQQDAFWYDNHDGWQDNSQPIVYYNPETKQYSDKPFTFKDKDVAQNLKFKQGGTNLFNSSERFKKRVMRKYPGLQNVYGEQGENLNIHKDKNFKASDYGYGNIEFIFPGGDGTVKYSDDYQYTSPTPDKYTVAYNPKGAKKGDIFLDLMHGMRDDPEYMKLLDNFSSAVTQGRGDDMDYFYQMDADRGFAPDGRQRWDENYIDGMLRSELSRKGLGRKTKDKRDYKLERSHNTEEMQKAADEIRQYLRTPKKLVYKKGGIIEESYELDASDDAIEYYKSLGYKVEYVDGGATENDDKGFEYTPPELNVAKRDNTAVQQNIPTFDPNLQSFESLQEYYNTMRTLEEDQKVDEKLATSNFSSNVTGKHISSFNDFEKEKKAEIEKANVDYYKKATQGDVTELQQELKALNYDLGSYGKNKDGIDGKFGSYTKKALESKMEDDAISMNTIDKYYNKYKGDNPEKYRDRVIKIQEALVAADLLEPSDIDGKFGNDTKNAVEKFNKNKNPDGFFFTNIPKSLKIEQCAKGMCEILEQNDVITEAIGVKYRNAWDVWENMNYDVGKGNSTPIFNIYDQPDFDNVKTGKELVQTTFAVKRRPENQTTADMYKTGDIVGIFWPKSDHHDEVLNSKTHNTHIGFVSSVKNGIPMITHNVHGNVKTEPYTNLFTGWIQRPNEDVQINEKYKPDETGYKVSNDFVKRFETKIERLLTYEQKNKIRSVAARAHNNAQKIPKLLGSDVDTKWLEAAVFGITSVESGAGISKIPRNINEAYDQRWGLTGLAYDYKDVQDEEISLGIGKTKYNSIDNFGKTYFDINKPDDLGDDDKAVDIVSYNLVKHYDTFKDYAKQFPELELTEDDIRSMAILAHNRGTSKLLTLGRRPAEGGKYNDPRMYYEEVQGLRDIARIGATQKDVTATTWRFAPDFISDTMVDESETYVSKVKRYIKEVYGQEYLDGQKEKTKEELEKERRDFNDQLKNSNLLVEVPGLPQALAEVPYSNTEEKKQDAPISKLYNRNIIDELTSKIYGNEEPLAPLRSYIPTTFKDGGEVQDIYDYLNNKLKHR